MVLLSAGAQAEDFDEWQQRQQAVWTETHRNERDAFQSYLNSQWQGFERFRAHVRDATPKPSRAPEVRDAGTSTSADAPVKADPPDLDGLLLPEGLPGWLIPPVSLHPQPADGIRRFYQRATGSQPDGLAEMLTAHATKLLKSDWMVWQVMQAAARHYYPDDPLRQTLISWLLMHQAGYAVRVGYDDSGVQLLLPIREKVYGRPWYQIGALTYYQMSGEASGTLYSYPQDTTARPLIVAIKQHPNLPQVKKEVTWSVAAPAPLRANASLASYYANYPQLDLVYYFAAPLSAPLQEQLRSYWQQHGKGESIQEKLTLLLNWLQHMPYATDQEQFGEENYLLPDEIFFYGASDCEDRAMLYVHWARALFGDQGLELIALDYPGHVAAGVAIPGEGRRWEGKGTSWLVADPTYVGAGLGMNVPQVDGIIPTLISVPIVRSR